MWIPSSQSDKVNAEVLGRLGWGRWATFDHEEVAQSHRAHIGEEMIDATYDVAGMSIECPATTMLRPLRLSRG
jgi:hypothetical protein